MTALLVALAAMGASEGDHRFHFEARLESGAVSLYGFAGPSGGAYASGGGSVGRFMYTFHVAGMGGAIWSRVPFWEIDTGGGGGLILGPFRMALETRASFWEVRRITYDQGMSSWGLGVLLWATYDLWSGDAGAVTVGTRMSVDWLSPIQPAPSIVQMHAVVGFRL